ncbi:MAG: nucleoside kinase, partial [Chloroflexi bacterium]|nr:nucleoside kinase [Chloroflexota bacterium]
LQPPVEYPALLATFREYGDWLERLGIAGVGTLNDAVASGRIQEVILVAEAFHERGIARIAEQIAAAAGRIRLVLIAGPSSSGKTTFAKRLTVQLLAHGLQPFALELDNYFVDREHTPHDEHGQHDYETIEAINRMRLNRDLLDLMAGRDVTLPRYNFQTGAGEVGETVRLHLDQIIILEGIHGLNPALLADLPGGQIFRVYVSALTQLNLDRYNRISTTDTRLVRRIVRDAARRGYNAAETLRRWASVRRGEKEYIFPYQENSDVIFNSALVYELSVLRPLADPLLRQVPAGSDEAIEARRLLSLLEWFLPCDPDPIPDDSLLREFVGGSNLVNFRLWRV